MKEIFWKAYCQRDNKEIQNYRLPKKNRDRSMVSFKGNNEDCFKNMVILHFLSKQNALLPLPVSVL